MSVDMTKWQELAKEKIHVRPAAQFWVNLNKIKGWENINLSVGGEVELSNNFVEEGFRAMPAIGAKWTF